MLGITMGDANGVGPEILLKTFLAGEITDPFVVFGDMSALTFCNDILKSGVSLKEIKDINDYQANAINVINSNMLSPNQIKPGEISLETGAAAREYIKAATQAALSGDISAIITLPINKKAVQLTDSGFCGHTEFIAALCGISDVTMMLASKHCIVTHVSTHVSMAEAVERVKRKRICTVIEQTAEALRRFIPAPRIAVAGLNPHAGESGMFGEQEANEILPAIETARQQGIQVEGPLPPDTVFYLAVHQKRFDAVVCMYHDQGHIPVKLLDFEGGVNITLGLPIIRTSVDHGTAFDIAYKGIASTQSFINAIQFAKKLTAMQV